MLNYNGPDSQYCANTTRFVLPNRFCIVCVRSAELNCLKRHAILDTLNFEAELIFVSAAEIIKIINEINYYKNEVYRKRFYPNRSSIILNFSFY